MKNSAVAGGLADEQVEYQIRDRLSFARCLGLGIEDAVPDATTVWRFRERLKELGLIDTLFDRFGDFLAVAGDQAREGQIVDASIVPVPIQRNQREENRRIKGRRSSGSTKKDTEPTRSLTSSKPTTANVPRSVPGSSTSSAFKKTA